MRAKYLLLLRVVIGEVLLLQALYAPQARLSDAWTWAILSVYAAFALALYWLDMKGRLPPLGQAASYLADIAACSAVLAMTRGVTSDVFIAYFVVILASCFLDDLKYSFVVGGVACLVYAAVAFPGADWALQPFYLLRLSFLLVTSFFSAYVASGARSAEIELQERYEQRVAWMQRLSIAGQALGGVLHEAKTPISTILLSAEYARKAAAAGKTAPVEEQLKVIEREAERAVEILARHLEFLRPEPLKLQDLTLQDPLQETLDAFSLRLRERDIELSADLGAPLLIEGSRRHLIQAFTNLMLNAVQAMPMGGRLTVRAAAQGGVALVTIADTGGGIEPAMLERLFRPFVTSKDDYEGHGLGLSVVRWIVHQHGGRVRLSSAGRGHGAAAEVVLPLASSRS